MKWHYLIYEAAQKAAKFAALQARRLMEQASGASHSIKQFRRRQADGTEQKGPIMRKVFKLDDLDCANCAAKMEDAINKIDGVEKASISFMAQKLTLVADDARFDAIVDEAQRAMSKIEPDCTIVR